MIVIWKKQCLNIVPVTNDVGSSKVILLPGVNEMPDTAWKNMEKALEHHIKAGNLEVVAEKVIVKKDNKEIEKKKAIPFDKLDPEKSISLIRECNNTKTLNKWKKTEKREEIRLEIANRLDEIKEAIKPTEKQIKAKKGE